MDEQTDRHHRELRSTIIENTGISYGEEGRWVKWEV